MRVTPEEREQLLTHLKLKWKDVNELYQKMSFTLDTPSKRKRKEDLEKQLTEIEHDIQVLEGTEAILVVK